MLLNEYLVGKDRMRASKESAISHEQGYETESTSICSGKTSFFSVLTSFTRNSGSMSASHSQVEHQTKQMRRFCREKPVETSLHVPKENQTNRSLIRAKFLRETILREKNRKQRKRRSLLFKRTIMTMDDSAEKPSSELTTASTNHRHVPEEMSIPTDCDDSHQTRDSVVLTSHSASTSTTEAQLVKSKSQICRQKLEARRCELVNIIKSTSARLVEINRSFQEDTIEQLDHCLLESEESTAENSFRCQPMELDCVLKNVVQVKDLTWTTVMPELFHGKFSGPALEGILPHGIGTLCFANGNVYSGPFLYGVCQGPNASFTTRTGGTYQGDFYCNLKHGRGEELFASGKRYFGRFNVGQPHGFGVKYDTNSSVLYLGMWHKGKPVNRRQQQNHANCEESDDESIVVAQDMIDTRENVFVSIYKG